MKSTALQLLFVFFSYASVVSAIKFTDPFEELLMQERLRQQAEQEQQNQRHTHADEPLNDVSSGSVTEVLETGSFVTTDLPTTSLIEKLMTTSTHHRETQSQCCVLGARAGRSGFLCNPENYRPQVLMRHDLNRMGNFKITREDRQRYVELRQHSKCVSGAVPRLSDEFQRCCKQAYIETLDEEIIGVAADDLDMPIMLELPLQIDIITKQRKTPRHKSHKV